MPPAINFRRATFAPVVFEAINAYQKTAALKAAIDLGLFTAIGANPSTAGDIASKCGCPERGIRILSDNLVIMGFLTKAGSSYALTPSSAVFLDASSPAYFGGAVNFLLAPGLTEAFGDLASTIRSGRLHSSEHGTTAPDHPAWIEFARAMGPMMSPRREGAADLVALDSSRDTRVLDISASHGATALRWLESSRGVTSWPWTGRRCSPSPRECGRRRDCRAVQQNRGRCLHG
ncbi:MAG: methyltransferase dimerization domain-containing protein [Verrucomicrobiales bacterium]